MSVTKATKEKLLIVEDDKVDQMAYARFFRDNNLPYDYKIASTVSEGSMNITSHEFDLIISDYLLGDGTAFDMMKLKPEIPFIVVTGSGNEEVAVQAMKLGAIDYLIKDPGNNHLKVMSVTVENALRRSQIEKQLRLLSHAVMSTEDPIYITDMNGIVTFVNAAFCKAYGYPEAEILGKTSHNLGEAKMDDSGYVYHTRQDGSQFPVSISRSMIRDKQEKEIALVCVVHDMTDRKKIEQMKTDFVSFVSHQLKTPALEIKGFVDNMLAGTAGELTEKQKAYLLKMQDISVRNHRLISDLLDVSKIDRGMVQVDIQPVKLKELLNLVVSDFSTALETKKLGLNFSRTSHEIIVLADQDRLTEVVRNILDNAIKFTDQGEISITIKEEAHYGIVEIADTGLGMSKKTLSQLFDKDLILSGAPRARGGSGLGLFIAKQFMRLQQGDITATSTPMQGSTFVLRIPKR